MWRLSKLALKSRLLTIIITVVVAGLSIWALAGLKMELIPDIEFPYATVVTIYPDSTPEMVTETVTTPIEEVIWNKWGNGSLKHLTSTSSEGISIIFAEFKFGTDMEQVSSTLKSEIASLTLPPEVTRLPEMSPSISTNPQIIPINLDIMPLKMLSVSGNYSVLELREIVESKILPAFNEIDGVLTIEVDGGAGNQLVISPLPARMAEHGVSVSQIIALMPKSSGSPEAIGQTPVAEGVTLGDVARISISPSPLSVINRYNGNPSIGISVLKESSANTVEVSDSIAEAIDGILPSLPEGVQVSNVFDQADFIKDSINELWEKAIVGGVLAVVIVFLFLRAIRASLLIAISVPLSVFIGFLCMYFSGITINILTLSGMSIAIGRLIDDSIVLVEVIYRRRQMGDSFKDAAIIGAREVATPVTAATLATVAIFVPLMFIGGMVGELFLPFGLTISFALLGSLVVALMVVPAMSKHLLAPRKYKSLNKDSTNWYQASYIKSLKWTLNHRAVVLVVTVILFIGSLGLIPVVGTSFMPEMGEKMITIDVQLGADSGLNATSEAARKVEAILAEIESVEKYFTTVGTSGSLTGMMGAVSGGGSNTASIIAYLDQDAEVPVTSKEIQSKTEGLLENGYIFVSGDGTDLGGFGGSQINLSIQGEDPVAVKQLTLQLLQELEGIDGLADLGADISNTVTRLDIKIDPGKVQALGLTEEALGLLQQEFMLLTNGGTLPGSTINIEGLDYPVYISAITKGLTGTKEAESLKIGFPQSVELGQIADISYVEMQSHISRTDLSLSATITGTITAKDIGGVNRLIQQKIDSMDDHPGVEIKTAGIAEQMQDSFNSMGIALIGAVGLAMLVMVLMMRSIRNPLIIMVSLPLASIGAMLGLLITGNTLSLFAMLGIVMLVGIVLTNAVVLISMIEDLRREGIPTHDAILGSGKARLRPILMTALTTIFAMLPLAIGIGSGIMMTAELAVVVIGGLVSSTVLTLFVIPVIYSLVNRKDYQKVK